MCKNRPQRPNFFYHIGPPNKSKWMFSTNLLKSFLWIHTNLALYAHLNYLQRCVHYRPLRPNFLVILGSQISKNSGIWSLSQEALTSCTSVLLHMFIVSTFRRVWYMGLRDPILGAFFWPQIKSKFRSLVIFSISFHWFHISIASHAHCEYFYRCREYRPKRPNFRVIVCAKIDHNSRL